MKCQQCGSERVLEVSARSKDMTWYKIGHVEAVDQYAHILGNGDHFEVEICLDCGQVQGDWPHDLTYLEEGYDPDQ